MGSCGYIVSPGYPVSYDSSHKCSWLIIVSDNAFIELTFEDFDIFEDVSIKCDRDFVDILDVIPDADDVSLGRYCNTYKPLHGGINSSWNMMVIAFFTDDSQNGKGFKVKYNQVFTIVPDGLTWMLNTTGAYHIGC